MLDDIQLWWHNKTVVCIDVKQHATNKQNNLALSRDIVALSFWRAWTCPGMPDQTQQILRGLTNASMDIYMQNANCMQKKEHYTRTIFSDIKI